MKSTSFTSRNMFFAMFAFCVFAYGAGLIRDFLYFRMTPELVSRIYLLMYASAFLILWIVVRLRQANWKRKAESSFDIQTVIDQHHKSRLADGTDPLSE